MVGSSDDEGGGKRDERRERRRQRVHDRLAQLIEENRMLTLLTQDDADEIQKLRVEVEAAEGERRRAVTLTEQQDTVIRQLQEQVFHLEHCKFVADVQAKTIEQQDKSVKELIEENKLMAAQNQMDGETIRQLHTQLNEAILERDRLATRVGRAIQRREEAEGEVKMLLEHADELRSSNVRLASRVMELEEKVMDLENEDYADFFTRISKRDIAQGKIGPSEGQLLLVRRAGTPLAEATHREALAASAGVSVEAMAEAQQRMPQLLTMADVKRHSGMMSMNAEDIRLLGTSGASPSPKRFSQYALQSQFGISPDKSKAKSSNSPLRNSKESTDFKHQKSDLPLPKSLQNIINGQQQHIGQREAEGVQPNSVPIAQTTKEEKHVEGSRQAVAGSSGGGSNTVNSSVHSDASSQGKQSSSSSTSRRERQPVMLPVRDALSGSIVADGGELPEDTYSGLNTSAMLSPSHYSDSDDEETESPNKTMERNTLLKERLEVQRQEKEQQQQQEKLNQQQKMYKSSPASRLVMPSQAAPQALDRKLAPANPPAPKKTPSGQGGSFKTQKEIRQQETDQQQQQGAVKLPPIHSEHLAMEPGQHEGTSTHYPPHVGGGASILLKANASIPSAQQQQQQPSRKSLPPLASSPQPQQQQTTTSPTLNQNRPSTVPLQVEAIYGERGGNSEDEKMYLVKFVSVESEQWTSAAFIDPGCEALQKWRKEKAKSRMKPPQGQQPQRAS